MHPSVICSDENEYVLPGEIHNGQLTNIIFELDPKLYGEIWQYFRSVSAINWWAATMGIIENIRKRDLTAVEQALYRYRFSQVLTYGRTTPI